MRWSWRIGTIAGIGVYMHATFLLLILFILGLYLHQGRTLEGALAGILFILVIFGCIVLHELGHALAARKYGIQTRDITLLPIGGLARLERMPDVPIQELWVALAGPAVNAVIAGGLYVGALIAGISPQVQPFHWTGGNFLNRLMVVNLWLLAFNLIPAFPMDGGRVLRAILATRMEYTRATVLASRIGQAIAYVFGFVGLFTDPFLLFIALFVWMGAEQEAAMVQVHTSLGGIPVQRAMLTEFRTLNPDDALQTAIDHTLAGWQQDFPVVFGDRVLGVLTREDVLRTIAQQGSGVHVREAMNREFKTVDSHDMLESALVVLHDCKCRSLPVVHDGQLVGMLTTDNVGEFLMIQSALRRARHGGPPRQVST
jgi:Zn-dependent protease/predicted transcriptional regulator